MIGILLRHPRRIVGGACLAALVAIGAAQPVMATDEKVYVPLDKTDARFGGLYVKALESVLYLPATKDPVPTIIYLHGCGQRWFGDDVSRNSATAYAAHFAKLGYATLLLNTSDERNLSDKPCHDRIGDTLVGVRVADLDAAVDWLVKSKIADPKKIVALGSSHGGFVIVDHAREHSGRTMLAGGIGLYPGWIAYPGTEFARYPLLILVGSLDDSAAGQSSPEVFTKYAATVNARSGSAKVDVVVYQGAGHDFDMKGLKKHSELLGDGKKHVSGYDKDAAGAALSAIDAFLSQVLK